MSRRLRGCLPPISSSAGKRPSWLSFRTDIVRAAKDPSWEFTSRAIGSPQPGRALVALIAGGISEALERRFTAALSAALFPDFYLGGYPKACSLTPCHARLFPPRRLDYASAGGGPTP